MSQQEITNFWCHVHHKTGWRENWYFNLPTDRFLDLYSQLLGHKEVMVSPITESQYNASKTAYTMALPIHEDLHEPNDALGDKVGYLEHYEVI